MNQQFSFSRLVHLSISQVEEHLLWIFDAFLDLAKEQNSLTSINNTMIISESHIHDWSGNDGSSLDYRAHLGCMHTKDGTLRHVQDWSSHHGSKDSTIGDGECASSHVLKSDLILTSLGSQASQSLLKVCKVHVLSIPNDWNYKACGRGHSSTDVNKVAVDLVAIINDGIDDWLLFQCVH